jgi:hypothetical protein
MFNFDEASKSSKDAMDGMLKSCSDVAKGFQAIATETTDYSRTSFQDMSSFVEAVVSARSLEAAYALQSTYMRSAYEGFVAQSTRLSDMYAGLAKTAYRPFEASSTPTAAVKAAKAA